MSVSTRIKNALLVAGLLPDALSFHRRIPDLARVQEARLLAYLRRNRDTAFGTAHGFGGIRSVRAYRDRVPIRTYEAFRPYLERIEAGEKRVLTAEDVSLLEPTGGSTTGSKLIPYTPSLKREFQRAVHPWVFDLYRRFPGLIAGTSYWSISPVLREETRTAGGLPIGFEDDADYLGLLGILLRGIFPVPGGVRRIRDVESFRYVTACFLLRSRDLALISVWNPTFLLLLLDQVEAHREALIRDVRDGTLRPPAAVDATAVRSPGPAPGRARELERAFGLPAARRYRAIWKRLRVISCWSDGISGFHAQRLARRFPGVHVQPKGLLATEGVVSFPLEGAGGAVPAYASHFFEFLPAAGGGPRLLHELERGETYTCLLTTGGGLYRYDLRDRIEVTGRHRGLPLIRFHDRSSVCDLVGEKLEEGHVQAVVERVLHARGTAFAFVLLAPDLTDRGGRYTLFLEPTEPLSPERQRALADDIDRGLMENFHYRYARDLGQLLALRVRIVGASVGQEAYLRRCTEAGQRLGDIKQTLLDARTGWEPHFAAGAGGLHETGE